MKHGINWTVVFVSFVTLTQSVVAAQDLWVGASPAFLQLRWPSASLLQVSLAEPSIVAGTKAFFSTKAVTVVNVRNNSLMDTDGKAAFEILFLIGDPTLVFNATVSPTTLNTTGIETALRLQLKAAVLNATTSPAVVSASVNNSSSSDPLWQVVTAFWSGNVTCQVLTSAEVLTLYTSAPNFPAIRTTATPTSAFLTFTVLLRNINESAANLAQSIVYQVRRGVAEFLGGAFNMSYVVSMGPATRASGSTLLVNQSFFLILPSTADTSMSGREAVEYLLAYGDLNRLVAFDNATTTRPAMFLDFIFPSTELAAMLTSTAIAASQSFAATIFPYAFRSIAVSTYPAGNPALPTASATDTASLLSATSDDTLNALLRKKQYFVYNPDGYLAALPQNVTYPSTVTMANLATSGAFTTTVYWSNTLTQEFWLERAESVDTLLWNLFPSTTFFTKDTTASSTSLPAPIVKVGNTSTPLWTLQAATPEHLEMALYFRSADNNATRVKVEVEVTLHTTGDAEAIVTSITQSSDSTSSSTVNPLDIVVRHQSRLLRNTVTDNPSKVLLLLELGVATTAEKASYGCTHCQQLYDWCTNESGCAALQTCVLTAIQSPISALVNATSTLIKTDDMYSLFNTCLSGSTTNALMLFTSAVRCQFQRMCAFSSPNSSIVAPSGTILVWDSGDGRHRIQPLSGTTNFPLPSSTPVNISLSIGGKVVCYLPMWNNATNAALETTIAQSCTFAKYLGTVKAIVSSNDVGATSIDILYSGLIGPMPILTPVSNGSQTEVVGATITTVSTPSIRLRLSSASGPIPYANSTDSVQVGTCAECKRLALDVCLRDTNCAAIADCVLQYNAGSADGGFTVEANSEASSTSTLADAVVQLVRDDASGAQLSFEAGVTACLPMQNSNGVLSVDVNGSPWRKLVNASACYSRSACPLVLAPMLSSSSTSLATTYTTVGKWTVTPGQRLQVLSYSGSTSSLSALKVPLVLKRDGVNVTATSAADPVLLEAALRGLIQYDDIAVIQTTVDSLADTAAKFAWKIGYGHWLSALPVFISTGSTEWTLAPDTSVPNDSVFELISRSTSSASTKDAIAVALFPVCLVGLLIVRMCCGWLSPDELRDQPKQPRSSQSSTNSTSLNL